MTNEEIQAELKYTAGEIGFYATQDMAKAAILRRLEAVLRELLQAREASYVKDRIIADCERMLRFSPPPKHLAESNQWQQAIQDAQAELMLGRPGQTESDKFISKLAAYVEENAMLRQRAELAEQRLAEARESAASPELIDDQPILPMPRYCTRWGCAHAAHSPATLLERNEHGFMVCPLCGWSYGTAPQAQENKHG